jgi:membrane protein required for colicin V production
MTVTILDYVIIGLLLFFSVLGFLKGMVSQLFSVFALILGFMGARLYFSQAQEFIGLSSFYGPIVGFLLTFIGAFLLVKMIGVGIEKIFKIAKLSFFNRFCGFLLGLLKGLVICTVFVSVLLLVYPEGKRMVDVSPSASYFFKAGKEVYRFFPKEIKDKYENLQGEKSK